MFQTRSQQGRRSRDYNLFVYSNLHVHTHLQYKAYHPTAR